GSLRLCAAFAVFAAARLLPASKLRNVVPRPARQARLPASRRDGQFGLLKRIFVEDAGPTKLGQVFAGTRHPPDGGILVAPHLVSGGARVEGQPARALGGLGL